MDNFKAEKNPLVSAKGLCDPHLRAFGGRVYLYTGHDAIRDTDGYVMDKWYIFSTNDMVNWQLEKEILPEQTFMGKSENCWAGDGCFRNGKHYFYFSAGGEKTGVLVSDTVSGEYRDVLVKPLLDGTNVPGREYDPAIFEDGDKVYIVFGAPSWAYKDDGGYFIAELNDDMISLKEKPRRILLNHPADDKVSMHKHNKLYYLCYASFYAVSENVYGPYTFVGNVGASSDHGSYMEWNGQWFKSFTIQDPNDYHRASGLCYVHYKDNGEMVCDQLIEEYGVGHYNSDWNKIQAEWYMSCENMEKLENDLGSFSVRPLSEGGYVSFPKVQNLKGKNGIAFSVMSMENSAVIEVYAGDVKICECPIAKAQFADYRGYRCIAAQIQQFDSDENDIVIKFKNCKGNSVYLDWFKFFKR